MNTVLSFVYKICFYFAFVFLEGGLGELIVLITDKFIVSLYDFFRLR